MSHICSIWTVFVWYSFRNIQILSLSMWIELSKWLFRLPTSYLLLWSLLKGFFSKLIFWIRENWMIKMKWIFNHVWKKTAKCLETAFLTVKMMLSVKLSVSLTSRMTIAFVHVRLVIKFISNYYLCVNWWNIEQILFIVELFKWLSM